MRGDDHFLSLELWSIQPWMMASAPQEKCASMNLKQSLVRSGPKISFICMRMAPFCWMTSAESFLMMTSSILLGSSTLGSGLIYSTFSGFTSTSTSFSLLKGHFLSWPSDSLKLYLLPPHQHFLSSIFSPLSFSMCSISLYFALQFSSTKALYSWGGFPKAEDSFWQRMSMNRCLNSYSGMFCRSAHFLKVSRGFRSSFWLTKSLQSSGLPPNIMDRPQHFFMNQWPPLWHLSRLDEESLLPWPNHFLKQWLILPLSYSFLSTSFLILRRLCSWSIFASQDWQRLKRGQEGHSYLMPMMGLARHPLHSMPSWTRPTGSALLFSWLRICSLRQGRRALILQSTSFATVSFRKAYIFQNFLCFQSWQCPFHSFDSSFSSLGCSSLTPSTTIGFSDWLVTSTSLTSSITTTSTGSTTCSTTLTSTISTTGSTISSTLCQTTGWSCPWTLIFTYSLPSKTACMTSTSSLLSSVMLSLSSSRKESSRVAGSMLYSWTTKATMESQSIFLEKSLMSSLYLRTSFILKSD